jgi:Flp pilus assembly protein TadG
MVERRNKRTGQAVLELALLIPFLLLIIANVVNFGGMFYAAITVANAARHGSQHFVYGSATVKNSATPSAASVWTLVSNDTAALPNPTSRVIRVCLENRNDVNAPACTTLGPGSATFVSPPLDTRPEAAAYLNGWVDVGYTYTPYIPLFTVPIMGIPLSPPPQQMVRQSLMRVLN